MAAQKRAPESSEDDPLKLDRSCSTTHTEDEDADESDWSPSSSSTGEKDEFIMVKRSDIRKEVQCPICLGIIRKTRTVMECLHRFCRECIDKSMRLGNNECPACRTHCASRRSLRDDPNYDSLIAALYPDIKKYEENELAFREEERVRNKQIQASIAQTLHRQSEAVSKNRPPSVRRLRGNNYRNNQSRLKRSYRNGAEFPASDDNEDPTTEDGVKDSSSAPAQVNDPQDLSESSTLPHFCDGQTSHKTPIDVEPKARYEVVLERTDQLAAQMTQGAARMDAQSNQLMEALTLLKAGQLRLSAQLTSLTNIQLLQSERQDQQFKDIVFYIYDALTRRVPAPTNSSTFSTTRE